jgi:hypothetical protein
MFTAPWVSDGTLFDVPLINERLHLLQHGLVTDGLQLTKAVGIEQWMREQVARGITRPPPDLPARDQNIAHNTLRIESP